MRGVEKERKIKKMGGRQRKRERERKKTQL